MTEPVAGKVRDALKEALATNDLKAVGRIVDRLRFRGCMTYDGIFNWVSSCVDTTMTKARWEDLMEEIDDLSLDGDED